MEFPQQQTVAGRQLPEDFVLRGSTLAQNYFLLHFFDDLNPSTKKRTEERPDYVVYRRLGVFATRPMDWLWLVGLATQPSSTFVDHLQANQYLGV
jgi:hypothetical protein